VDRYGNRAAFSTKHWYATVAAPGVDVVIADPNRHYYEGWGTSTASAYVAGTVALIRSRYPKLSPAQIKTVLERSARDRPAGGRSDALGSGVVNPPGALAAAAELRPAPARPVPASYPHRSFGPATAHAAPAAAHPGGGGPLSGSGAVAAGFALGGLALLVTGGVLLRRRAPAA
jgi:subtilisin family serine protease